MSDRREDRHKTRINQPSGAQKRKMTAEKEKKLEEIISKTAKISSYFSVLTPDVDDVNKEISSSSSSCGNATSSAQTTPVSIPSVELLETLPVTIDEHETNRDSPSASTSALEPSVSDDGNKSYKENAAQITEDEMNFRNDVGLWTKNISQKMIDFWITKGSDELQHCDDELFLKHSICQSRNDRETPRRCSMGIFKRTHTNNEQVNRFWLCFSPSTGKVYCYVCKLMSCPSTSSTTNFYDEGFCNWKKAGELIAQHETSKHHMISLVAFANRSDEKASIDRQLKEQVIYFYYLYCTYQFFIFI